MFRKKHPAIGARPGTLVFDGGETTTRIHVVRYCANAIDEPAHASLADVRPPQGQDQIVWIDITGYDKPEILMMIAGQFNLSPLAMEDLVNVPQRPKVETLDERQLVIAHTLVTQSDGRIRTDQLNLLLGENYVLTLHQGAGRFLEPIRGRLRRSGSRIRQSGADYLAYAIIDSVVDGYYPVLEWIGEELEQLEGTAMERPHPDLLKAIHSLRTQLIQVRRSGWPLREVVESLSVGDGVLVSDETRRYLRDTMDHCVQIVDVIEMYRESAGALVSMYMSAVAHRSNEIMKVLAIMSSIFVPLTFIAGVYGMNFQNMPELGYAWGYPAALASMFATASGMLWFFTWRGWFGSPRRRANARNAQAIDAAATSHRTTTIQLDHPASDATLGGLTGVVRVRPGTERSDDSDAA